MTIARPGLSVRLYRPNRSTTPARAWGITRTVFASVTRTTTATTPITIRAMLTGSSFSLCGDQGSHALDLDDLHLSAFFERLPFDVRARGPILAADPYQTVDLVHTA